MNDHFQTWLEIQTSDEVYYVREGETIKALRVGDKIVDYNCINQFKSA